MSRTDLIRLGLFHQPLGRHPAAWRRADATARPLAIEDAIEVAQLADRGFFDVFFLGDALAGPTPGAPGRAPTFEPLGLLNALAVATERIGLVATISTSFTEPYAVARALASLDHLSGGRAGWNVVTSQDDAAARNHGSDRLPDHATRYRRAAEHVEVSRRLWDSWDPDAVVMDQEAGIAVDGSRVRGIDHRGEFFRVDGPLNIARPPQGHPLIVQAGSSADGIGLAASVADVVFTAQDGLDSARDFATQVADAARSAGRAERPLILPGIMPILAPTPDEARELFTSLQSRTDVAAGIRQLSHRWGYDLSTFPLDGPVPDPRDDVHGQSRVQLLLERARADDLTLQELASYAIASHGHRILVGSPEEVADDLQSWFESGACDGFNIIPAQSPRGVRDVTALLVPELQRRGLVRTEHATGTLRERLGLPGVVVPALTP